MTIVIEFLKRLVHSHEYKMVDMLEHTVNWVDADRQNQYTALTFHKCDCGEKKVEYYTPVPYRNSRNCGFDEVPPNIQKVALTWLNSDASEEVEEAEIIPFKVIRGGKDDNKAR